MPVSSSDVQVVRRSPGARGVSYSPAIDRYLLPAPDRSGVAIGLQVA